MADINNSVNDDTHTGNGNINTDNPVNHNTDDKCTDSVDSNINSSSTDIDKTTDSNSSNVDTDNTCCNTVNIHTDNGKSTKLVGNGNLIPFDKLSEDEHRKIASNGGIKSGETRRKKRDLKEIARAVLAAQMSEDQIEEVLSSAQSLLEGDKSVAAVLTVRMAQEAGKGNYKAFETLRDTAGYKPKDQMEIETFTDADRQLLEIVNNRLHPKNA